MSDATMEKFKAVFSNAVLFSSGSNNGRASGAEGEVKIVGENYDPQLSVIQPTPV